MTTIIDSLSKFRLKGIEKLIEILFIFLVNDTSDVSLNYIRIENILRLGFGTMLLASPNSDSLRYTGTVFLFLNAL